MPTVSCQRLEFSVLQLVPVVARMPAATLLRVEAADHSFHVPRKCGRRDAEVEEGIIAAVRRWLDAVRTDAGGPHREPRVPYSCDVDGTVLG